MKNRMADCNLGKTALCMTVSNHTCNTLYREIFVHGNLVKLLVGEVPWLQDDSRDIWWAMISMEFDAAAYFQGCDCVKQGSLSVRSKNDCIISKDYGWKIHIFEQNMHNGEQKRNKCVMNMQLETTLRKKGAPWWLSLTWMRVRGPSLMSTHAHTHTMWELSPKSRKISSRTKSRYYVKNNSK